MSWLPCITVFPSRSHSAELKSRAYITKEWQVRRICSAISSTMVVNEFFSTSKVTGSSVVARASCGIGASYVGSLIRR